MNVNKINIKLFITDIDGVWTDGGMYYASDGTELKKFSTADSAGVLLLGVLGIPVAIITGENTQIVDDRAKKLRIERVHQGIRNKVACAEKILEEFDFGFESVAFIGDDLNDLSLLAKVGLSACPANAPDYVKERVDWPLPVKGGDGAFRDFVERYLNVKELLDEALHRSNEFFKSENAEGRGQRKIE